jgi:tetratricopeptide (TPR) repeat protein
MALEPKTPDIEYAFHVAWNALFPAHRAWLADRPADALAILSRVIASPPRGTERTNTLFRQLNGMALTLGRLGDADRIAAQAVDSIDASSAPDPTDRDDLALAVLVYRGDRPRIKELLRQKYSTPSSARRVLWLPISNDLFFNQLSLVATASHSVIYDSEREFAQARLDLASGHIDEAIRKLSSVSIRRGERGISRLMCISVFTADAWLLKGQIEPAIKALEESTRERAATTFGASSAALWMHTRARLADLYRKAGRVTEAEASEEHLRRLLAVADDDHPLKMRLARTATDSP